MITQKHKRFLLTLILAFSMIFSVSSPVQADAPAPDPDQAEFEIGFMQDMIDHHASAVMMAKFCIQRAVHEELIALCQQMMEDQAHEIELMSEWLMDWYGIDYKPRISPEERKMMSHLLRHQREEFEMHFMHMMIMHHSMAVEMSRMCLEMAYHPELVSQCETIIASQVAEIEQMQMWLCEWYEHCNGGHHRHMMS